MMPALAIRGRLGPGIFTRGWFGDGVTTAFKGPLIFTFSGIAYSQISDIQVAWA